jgi:hypothetical protein
MGFRFGKSFRIGKAFRINVSKSGIGASVGVPGFRVGVGPRGVQVSAGVPGTGFKYVSRSGWGHAQQASYHSQAPLYQQQTVQREVILADMLFHTERRAKQLTVIASEDKLVAAMWADEWLASVGGVTSDDFLQLEHKRAWSAAAGRLHTLGSVLQEPSASDLLRRVRGAQAEFLAIQQAVGDPQGPEARSSEFQQRAEAIAKVRTKGQVKLAIGLAVVGIFIILGALAAIGGADAGAMGCLGTLAVAVGLLPLTLGVRDLIECGDQENRLQTEVDGLEQTLTRWRAFAEHPQGGVLLDWFNREHPTYIRPLPNVDDMGPLGGSSPHVIERQVVLARCRYCKAMTPADGPACRNCGAGAFL